MPFPVLHNLAEKDRPGYFSFFVFLLSCGLCSVYCSCGAVGMSMVSDCSIFWSKSEYDQEIPPSHTADQPTAQ